MSTIDQEILYAVFIKLRVDALETVPFQSYAVHVRQYRNSAGQRGFSKRIQAIKKY